MQLQEKIKSIRLNANMTQSEFAKTLGISQGKVSELEKGTNKPSFDTLKSLKINFGISIDMLIDDNSKRDNFCVQSSLTDFEINILKLLSQLPDREKYKLEGMLEYKVAEMNEAKTGEKKCSAYTF